LIITLSTCRFDLFQSQNERERNVVAQREAVALVQRMVRSSDFAVNHLRNSTEIYNRLMKVLDQIVEQESLAVLRRQQQQQQNTKKSQSNDGRSVAKGRATISSGSLASGAQARKKKNSTTIVEYANLNVSQMARVASWGLGGVQWRPKVVEIRWCN